MREIQKYKPDQFTGSDELLYKAEMRKQPKIHQDVKIISGGNGNVTINMNASVSKQKERKIAHDPNLLPMQENQLINLIDTFPEPQRLRNFIDYIYTLALKFKGTRTGAGAWLGVNERTIRRSRIGMEDI